MMFNEDGLIYLNENLDTYIRKFDNITVSTEYIDNKGQKQERLEDAYNEIKIYNP